MTTARALLPRGSALLAIDVVLVVWVVAWGALGIAVAGEVRGLRQLSETVADVGQAARETGQVLGALEDVPLVGGTVGEAAREVDDAGRSAIESARRSRESVDDLQWMLGLFLAVVPSIPVLGLYVPLRVAAARERRALARLVRERRHDPVLRHLLAQRALLTTPYRHLEQADEDPVVAAREEHLDLLADEELRRLGVSRSLRG
ncbi:MAG TPA: hypothetical protein VD931_20835 [Baekduia sp.]|nr:hypothetical protein [Baekduia sp.]